jgi:hypothetical protein
MSEVQSSDRMAMGCRSRKPASEWFGLQRFVTDYEEQYSDMIKVCKEKRRVFLGEEESVDLVR